MRLLLTGLVYAGGLFFLLAGIGFLTNPASAGADFGLTAAGAKGLSSIRADLTAFFLVASGSMVLGVWQRNAGLLLVAASLFGIALFGRIVGLVVDGSYEGALMPMAVEAVSVVVLYAASRVLAQQD